LAIENEGQFKVQDAEKYRNVTKTLSVYETDIQSNFDHSKSHIKFVKLESSVFKAKSAVNGNFSKSLLNFTILKKILKNHFETSFLLPELS